MNTLLFLSGIAGSEIIIILLFALLFFGSKSIPGLSRSLGRGIRQIKDASHEVKSEIRKTTSEMKKEMDVSRNLSKVSDDVTKPFKSVSDEVEQAKTMLEKEAEDNSSKTSNTSNK